MSRGATSTEITRFLDAWFAVRQLIQAANFNRFQSAGLSASQFMTLNLLPADNTGISIGDLARRMNLKPATVAKTVDSLEERAMLHRRRSPDDGRVVLLSITPAGRELQNAAAGHFRDHITSLFQAMTAIERTELVTGLESLVRAASSEAPGLRDKTWPGRPNREAAASTRVTRAAAPASRSSRRSPQP